MLLIPIFAVALIGHCLAVADPNRSATQTDVRKPMLVYATNGERKTIEEDKKSGFRRSIPPGALGFAGGFDAGFGTGFVPNGGLGFGTGFVGMPNNNYIGGMHGNSFGTAGLGNNLMATGYTGATFGVDGLSNPLGYRNPMVYSQLSNNMGGFGVNTGYFNQPGIGTGYLPQGLINTGINRHQGLMTNNFNGLGGAGGFNDLTGYNSFGMNGNGANGFNGLNGLNNFNGFGGVNTFRNGANSFSPPLGTFVPQSFNGVSSLNGLSTDVGYHNNFGSLNNGINGFSSANSLNNRFSNGFNNGLNNFSSFNTGTSGGFNNPSQFGSNAFSENNSFKRSPLDPTSPYYIQLYNNGNFGNNEDEQADQSSGWNNRNSGMSASIRGTSASTVTSHSAGGQIRSNSDTASV